MDGNQWGFCQSYGGVTNGMNVTVSGLSPGSQYYVSFRWAMRNQADSSEAVGYHVSLWTTSGWTDLWYTLVDTSQPWTPATSSPWTATTTTALLQVSISETLTTDHSILVDLIQVLVVPPVLGFVGISIGNPSSFEYPVLANTTYAQQSTNPGALLVLPTAAVPWYFPLGSRAGIATIGSFWDPLPGSAAPDGRQYMILQEYSLQPVNAWTYVLGLVKGSSYYLVSSSGCATSTMPPHSLI